MDRVSLDADLAELYGVQTKRLNEQVKRNAERFPEDFAFRLTPDEKTELAAKCDRCDYGRQCPELSACHRGERLRR